MNLFKRVTATVLAALMLAMSLAGCSGEEKKEPEEPKNLITVSKSVMSGDSYGDTKLYALKDLTTSSPNGKIEAKFWQGEDGGIYYSVESD